MHFGNAARQEGDRQPCGFRMSCEAVREAVPLEEVAERYTELRPVGDRHVGRCPLPDHADENPSFYLYPDGRWWCFGCSRGGDVVDLEFFCGDHGELWEAMISLAVEFGVELPRRPERWHEWNGTKAKIHDAAEEARKTVRRERMFKLMVLSRPEFEIEDAAERQRAVALAWQTFESGMKRIGR